MSKGKKHRLPFVPGIDHAILAVASHEKGYHLAWALNNTLGMELVQTGEYVIPGKKQDTAQHFPLYGWFDETRMTGYHLVANRSGTGVLVPKMKNIDYFLHISPRPGEDLLENLLEKIRQIPAIITAFPVDPGEHPRLAEMIFE